MNSIDRRRFPRIRLGSLPEVLKSVTGAKVVGFDESACQLDVYDLSYEGVAMRAPAGVFTEGNQHKLTLALSGYDNLVAEGVIIRATLQSLAIKLTSLAPGGRMILAHFLKDKVVGLHTYLVAPQFYSNNAEFSDWFHGPAETNIVLWQKGGPLTRALFEMERCALFYEKNHLSQIIGARHIRREDDDYTFYIDNFDEEELRPEKKNVQRALDILSQIEDKQGKLTALSTVLKSAL